MIKSVLPGTDTIPVSTAPDVLHSFLLEGANLRGAILRGTRMTLEMRTAHGLGPLETLVLGHGCLAMGVLSGTLKGRDRMSLRLECEGPFSGLSVETNAVGDVRGYLFKNPFPLNPADLENPSLAALWGSGILTMTRFPEGATAPFTGQVSLEEGSLAINLARYYLRSEQKPTAFVLSTDFDRSGSLLGAGAIFLQPLPGADEGILAEIEERLPAMPSLGAAFAEGTSPEEYLKANFGKYFPRVLDERRVEFFCPCSRERFAGFIGALPIADIADMAANGPFPVRAACHYCNSTYEFGEEDMKGMLKRRIKAE